MYVAALGELKVYVPDLFKVCPLTIPDKVKLAAIASVLASYVFAPDDPRTF